MPAIKSVRAHVLRDTKKRRVLSDDIRLDKKRDRDVYENRVAFTNLLWNPNDGMLYCGITAWNHDIFHRFDPEKRKFESLGFAKIAEEFEIKIHRSLELASDGTIYSAGAAIIQEDQRQAAAGGSIFTFTPGPDTYKKLCIPCKRDYIQTITLDEKRRLVYGCTCPVYKFFVYHIDTGEVEDFDYMGSITHIGAIDDSGCYWGTWNHHSHFLYKYDPSTRKITWFRHSVPNGVKEANIMYLGAGPVDVMINGGDGYLYIGTAGGSLCRLDPKTAQVDYLGRPAPTQRLPGLVVWKDSLMLGACGDLAGGYLFSYDRETGAFRNLGSLIDSKTGEKLYRVHDLCVSPDRKTAYIAETDVPDRSGYLWEVSLSL